MKDTELLQMALGLKPPWQVSTAEFHPDEKRLDKVPKILIVNAMKGLLKFKGLKITDKKTVVSMMDIWIFE